MKLMNKVVILSGAAIILTVLSCSKPYSGDASAPAKERFRGQGMTPGSAGKQANSADSGKLKDSVAGLKQKRGRSETSPVEDDRRSGEKKTTTGKGKKNLKFILLQPFDQASGRYLEYTVSLSYKTKDLEGSRKVLLDIASKYGFIKSSNARVGGDVPYLNAGLHLKSDRLYAALKELDKLGVLKSENIRVNDHTENMFWRGVQMRREGLRLRRKAGFGRIGLTSKNWNQRNRSLELSENNEDKARFERWKMKDRVSWAKVQINLSGPELPSSIRVPRYQNALIGLVNLALGLSYVLVWMTPLFLLLGLLALLIWKRQAIYGMLRRGKPAA